jgi:hypothetical protein
LRSLVDISLLRASFAVLQTFSNHSESQSLYRRDRRLLALAIGQGARQLQDLSQPPAILFPLYLDLKGNHERGRSERLGFAGCVPAKGLRGKVVKPPGLSVSFELAVPCRPVVFEEPSTNLRKLRWGERLDLLLDLLDLIHDFSTGIPL